jgi:HAD superfamily hydrolase (TIGR01549 family)
MWKKTLDYLKKGFLIIVIATGAALVISLIGRIRISRVILFISIIGMAVGSGAMLGNLGNISGAPHKRSNEVIEETEGSAKKYILGSLPLPIWERFNEKILEKLGYEGDDITKKGETLRLESWTNPNNFNLFSDVRPTLEKLAEQNLLIGCISNEAEGLNKFFTHFDIDEYFNSITISDVVKCKKPSKEIFEIALKDLNIEPNEAIFVGDSLVSDYEGAKNAGLKAILIDRENKIDDNDIDKIESLTEIISIIEKENTYASTTS